MPATENQLIRLLSAADRKRLQSVGEVVDLELAQVLCEPNAPTKHVYFIIKGFISLIAQPEATAGVEVGMIGREGMLGAHVILGSGISPLRALVQGEGTAWRVTISDFLSALGKIPALDKVLRLYTHVNMVHLANAAACQRFHLVSARLARWLLMSQDRAHNDRFHLTQEFLAYMLGVRRVGVTQEAHTLQRMGLIEYTRGDIHVVDRLGLEQVACSCYATDLRVYSKWLDRKPGH